MTTTLEEARGIVQGFFGSRPRRGVSARNRNRRGIRLPNTGNLGNDDEDAPAPGTKIKGPTFNEAGGDRYVKSVEEAIDRINRGDYTAGDVKVVKDAGLLTTDEASDLLSGATGGGGRVGGAGASGSDDALGYANLSQRGREESNRAAESARDYARSIFESDRGFGQGQIESNRAELGSRFGGGISLGGLFLDLASRDDRLAKDPENFPAYLNRMQGVSGQGPALQELVGQGVHIDPTQSQYLDDPRFKQVIDSMLGYANAPSGGDVTRTQEAYNQDPEAARRFFSQDPEALRRMFGPPMAGGGSFTTNGPMTFRDLSSGQPMGIAGEQGQEQVTVTPMGAAGAPAPAGPAGATGDASQGRPRLSSGGTFGALAKALRAGGYGSAFSPGVLQRMEQGFAPNPGDVPDWILDKLPPSLKTLLGAGIMAQLGGTGAEDYDWTRGLYAAKGFSGLEAGVQR